MPDQLTAPDVPTRRRAIRSTSGFVAAALASFSLLFGTNLATPLYAVFAERLQFGTFALTAVYAVYFLALVPTLLAFGSLSDRFGRRRIIAIGLLIALAASLGLFVADSLGGLLVGRAAQGVAVGLLSGALSAALLDASPRYGALASSLSIVVGGTLGPLAGGLTQAVLPGRPGAAFLLVAALLAASLAATTTLPGRAPRDARGPESPAPSGAARSGRARAPRGLLSASCASGIVWASAGLSLGLLPTALRELVPDAPALFGTACITIMMGVSAVVQLALIRRTRTSARLGTALAPVALAVLLLGLVVADGWPGGLAIIVIGSALSGFALALGFLGGLRAAGTAAPVEHRGRVMSTFFAISYLATGIPTLGVGALATIVPLEAAMALFLLVIIIAAVATLVTMRMPRQG